MKRYLFHFIIALLAFAAGNGLSYWRDAHNSKVNQEQHVKRMEADRVDSVFIVPQNLSAELLRIDRIYKERCRTPNENDGGWVAIKNIDSFRQCNDEWAKARREAIIDERDKHLIQY